MKNLIKLKIMIYHITNLTKEDYFSKLKNGYPDDEEIERTNKNY